MTITRKKPAMRKRVVAKRAVAKMPRKPAAKRKVNPVARKKTVARKPRVNPAGNRFLVVVGHAMGYESQEKAVEFATKFANTYGVTVRVVKK